MGALNPMAQKGGVAEAAANAMERLRTQRRKIMRRWSYVVGFLTIPAFWPITKSVSVQGWAGFVRRGRRWKRHRERRTDPGMRGMSFNGSFPSVKLSHSVAQ